MLDGPQSRETKGPTFLPSTSNFIQSRRSYGQKLSESPFAKHYFANNSKTTGDNQNLIGFASPLLDIAVILRPNSTYFRSAVPEISDQSERSVTFWPVSPKPLKLAHFRLAPPTLNRALPFHWSCHKTDSINPVLLYANELLPRLQRPLTCKPLILARIRAKFWVPLDPLKPVLCFLMSILQPRFCCIMQMSVSPKIQKRPFLKAKTLQ